MLAAFIALFFWEPAFAAPDPGAEARTISNNLGLQTDLPGKRNDLITPKTRTKELETKPSQAYKLDLGFFVLALFYAAIAAGIAFAFWILRDRLPVLGRRNLVAKKETVRAERDASVERMAAAQMEADDLASQGRLADAMHALLLRSLIEVRRRLHVSFAESLTSREILSALSLPEGGKRSLGDIVHSVEIVYFGERPANERDYASCRESYERLIQAMQTKAAA